MNYNRLKELARLKKIAIKDLAVAIGLTEGGFHSAMTNHSLKIRDLEKVSEVLKVDISYFFSEDSPSVVNDGGSMNYTVKNQGSTTQTSTHTVNNRDSDNDCEKRLQAAMKEIELLTITVDSQKKYITLLEKNS